MFIPQFVTYHVLQPTHPKEGAWLIYNPESRTSRINSDGLRLRWLKAAEPKFFDEWSPRLIAHDWIAAAIEIAQQLGLRLEQAGYTHRGHPIFYLRA